MRIVRIILLLAFAFLIAILVTSQDTVQLKFLSLKTQPVSIAILILGSLLLGAALTGMVSYFSHIKLRNEIAKRDKTIKELEAVKKSSQNANVLTRKESGKLEQ
jgi:uncharacterized integral membrane protein